MLCGNGSGRPQWVDASCPPVGLAVCRVHLFAWQNGPRGHEARSPLRSALYKARVEAVSVEVVVDVAGGSIECEARLRGGHRACGRREGRARREAARTSTCALRPNPPIR